MNKKKDVISPHETVSRRRDLVFQLMVEEKTIEQIEEAVADAGFTANKDTLRHDRFLVTKQIKNMKTPLDREELITKAVEEYEMVQQLAILKGDLPTAMKSIEKKYAIQGVSSSGIKSLTVNTTNTNNTMNTVALSIEDMKNLPLAVRKGLLEAKNKKNINLLGEEESN